VDKIEQFQAELADAHAPPAERLLALQFLLHLVGDLHQPLHACAGPGSGNGRREPHRAHQRERSADLAQRLNGGLGVGVVCSRAGVRLALILNRSL
jgi:hypothetical protein